MCQGCWIEEGSPKFDTPELRALASRVSKVDEFGGCHIVVDDWNLEDGHIQFCLDQAETTPDEAAVMRDLMAIPELQRYSVLAMAEGLY